MTDHMSSHAHPAGPEKERAERSERARRAFRAFYICNAELVYNLALRITNDRRLALRATEQAFLSHLDLANGELVLEVIEISVKWAENTPVRDSTDMPEPHDLAAAVAALPVDERAMLAFACLAKGSLDTYAAAFRMNRKKCSAFLERSLTDLGIHLGLLPIPAAKRYRAWPTVAAPESVWQSLEAQAFAAIDEHVDLVLTLESLIEPSPGPNGSRSRMRRLQRMVQRVPKASPAKGSLWRSRSRPLDYTRRTEAPARPARLGLPR